MDDTRHYLPNLSVVPHKGDHFFQLQRTKLNVGIQDKMKLGTIPDHSKSNIMPTTITHVSFTLNTSKGAVSHDRVIDIYLRVINNVKSWPERRLLNAPINLI